MRIAMVSRSMEVRGGTETHMRDLTSGLLKEGMGVSVITGARGSLTDEIESKGAHIELVPELAAPFLRPHHHLAATFKLAATLRALQPDVVHSHEWRTHLAARTAPRILGLPSLHTVHGLPVGNNPFDPRWLVIYAGAQIASFIDNGKTIYVSEADRDRCVTSGYSREENSYVIHNGIPDVSPELRRDFSQTDASQPVRLVMVARIQPPQKDHETIIRALSQLKDINWEIDFIGHGDATAYETMAYDLGIAGRCNFRGEIVGIEPQLASKDALILTSQYEGLPISIIEAMRAGLPVIANNVGGNNELVQDGVNGFLTAYQDVDTLAQRLRMIIEDQALRAEMGQCSRILYEQNFSQGQMVRATIATYNATIAEHRVHVPRPAFLTRAKSCALQIR